MKQLVMGNEAIALGAIRSGVSLVAGYPGTPSSEVLETIAKKNPGDIYVEWSVNEKAAMEVAAAGAYTGARVMVTMKQVGLNVAADPLMSLNYVGVKGGMVVMVADDPGPISSQTEQDTRRFAKFAKMMLFDPTSPEEAYQMIQTAFEYSEKYRKPVFFRPTTRVCHGYQSIEISEKRIEPAKPQFIKDSKKWVIFPRLSYQAHQELEKMKFDIANDFSALSYNQVSGTGVRGIAAGGVSYEYAKEVLGDREDVKLFKVATPCPFPEQMALSFLDGLKEVLVLEELDPVIEEALTYICGKHHLQTTVYGKLSGHTVNAGENTVANVAAAIAAFLGKEAEHQLKAAELPPELPIRPPVLCAGCPHRASFYAVKKAMAGKECRFCGDIGCYTLGNAMPLDMVDTCLCMGADVTMAQGFSHLEKDTVNFAFIGDSTFFASGITGVVNAVYNEADMTLVVLDNSTTAMTGHQPHPGTGVTMMGDIVNKISIVKILEAIGLTAVETVNPLQLEETIETVKRVSALPGVKAIIMKSPCIALEKTAAPVVIEDSCINCKKCIKDLGCPAIVLKDGRPFIESGLCFGCDVCSHVCPVQAIKKSDGKEGGQNE